MSQLSHLQLIKVSDDLFVIELEDIQDQNFLCVRRTRQVVMDPEQNLVVSPIQEFSGNNEFRQ